MQLMIFHIFSSYEAIEDKARLQVLEHTKLHGVYIELIVLEDDVAGSGYRISQLYNFELMQFCCNF